MRGRLGTFCGTLGLLAAFGLAVAIAPASAGSARSPYIGVGGPTSVPYGWVDFCRRYTGECDGGPLPALDVNLTAQAMKELDKVNAWVNANVESVSDMDHWGVIDQWDYPTDGKGDCEDYVLYKRKLLMQAGFPRQALLVTVVKDTHGDGHAVLMVKTNKGELVLDNLVGDIKPWYETGYRYVKRQSQTDQNVWVSIGEPTQPPAYVSR